MKRILLRQMLNEWRANVWLIIELLIVLIVLQFIFSSLYSLYVAHGSNEGYDLNNIYISELGVLQEGDEGYQPYDSVHSPLTDFKILSSKLRENPYIEIVAPASVFSLPYQYNYFGTSLRIDKPDGTNQELNVNYRYMSPELFLAYRIHGLDGETPQQLASILAKDELIISDHKMDMDSIDPRIFLHKYVSVSSDTLRTYHIGAIAHGLRRADYEPLSNSVCYKLLPDNQISHIIFRVKPEAGSKFEASLKSSDMTAGNVYIKEPVSVEVYKDTAHLEINRIIRDFTLFAIFLLIVIFLGFLGTFWFRTQQRAGEIAIRKINGATNRNIYIRLFSEGLILLAIATLLSLPVTYWLVKINLPDTLELIYTWPDTVIAGLIFTIIVLALIIIAGIYAPAHGATKIEPAEAVKDI